MIAQIQVRRGTTAEWAAAAPVVLEAGELGYDATLNRLKVGDGATEWASLEWIDYQIRRGTTAEWAASPVVLAAGEPGYDTTLKMLKFGDGTTEWASLESETLKKYPVGAIYQSTVSTSPATLFGGTWSALGGRFLIGADETYEAGNTGGAATHTHTLGDAGFARIAGSGSDLYMKHVLDNIQWTANLKSTGSGSWGASGGKPYGGPGLGGSTDSGSSLPPYKAVYMWERTA